MYPIVRISRLNLNAYLTIKFISQVVLQLLIQGNVIGQMDHVQI